MVMVKTTQAIEDALIDVIYKARALPDSLQYQIATKYKLKNAFVGSELIELLYTHHTFQEAIQICMFNYEVK